MWWQSADDERVNTDELEVPQSEINELNTGEVTELITELKSHHLLVHLKWKTHLFGNLCYLWLYIKKETFKWSTKTAIFINGALFFTTLHSQSEFGGTFVPLQLLLWASLSCWLCVGRHKGRSVSSVCGITFISPGAYFCAPRPSRLLWHKLGKVSLSRCHGDRVKTRGDLVLHCTSNVCACVSVSVFFMDMRNGTDFIHISDPTVYPQTEPQSAFHHFSTLLL